MSCVHITSRPQNNNNNNNNKTRLPSLTKHTIEHNNVNLCE